MLTPTYKNGTTVGTNDYVIGATSTGGAIIAGIVHSFREGNTIKIVQPELGRTVFADVDASGFYRADEAFAAAELIRTGKVQPIVGATPTPAAS